MILFITTAVKTSNPTRDYMLDLGEDGRIIFKSDLREYVLGRELDSSGSG
jgi:hypothetical protein